MPSPERRGLEVKTPALFMPSGFLRRLLLGNLLNSGNLHSLAPSSKGVAKHSARMRVLEWGGGKEQVNGARNRTYRRTLRGP